MVSPCESADIDRFREVVDDGGQEKEKTVVDSRRGIEKRHVTSWNITWRSHVEPRKRDAVRLSIAISDASTTTGGVHFHSFRHLFKGMDSVCTSYTLYRDTVCLVVLGISLRCFSGCFQGCVLLCFPLTWCALVLESLVAN